MVCDIGSIQLDNMNPKAEHPVAIAKRSSRGIPLRSQAETEIRERFGQTAQNNAMFSVTWQTDFEEEVSGIENNAVFVALQPLLVAIDEVMCAQLYRLGKKLSERSHEDELEVIAHGGDNENGESGDGDEEDIADPDTSDDGEVSDSAEDTTQETKWTVEIASTEILPGHPSICWPRISLGRHSLWVTA